MAHFKFEVFFTYPDSINTQNLRLQTGFIAIWKPHETVWSSREGDGTPSLKSGQKRRGKGTRGAEWRTGQCFHENER